MMTWKKYCETAGFSSEVLPSNFKPAVSDVLWGFRSKCSAAPPPLAAVSDATYPKPRATTVVIGGKDDWSGNGKIPSSPDREKFEMAIAAVPLRSVPSYDMKTKPEKSVSSHGKDHGEGQKKGKTFGNMVHQKEELWKHERDKLAAVIAEAKEFISLLGAKSSTPKTFPAAEDIINDTGESKNQHQFLNSDAFPLHTPVDQSLSMKRLKVSSGISVVVQEENDCPTVTMSEDEDQVSFLSPVVQEENACGTETISEDEDEVCLLSPEEWDVWHLRVNQKDERVKSQGINIDDYIDPVSFATKTDQPIGRFPICDLTETKSEDEDEVSFLSPVVREENTCGIVTLPEDEKEVSFLSPDVQEENACVIETMSEDEDEVCLLSPAEWEAWHLCVNQKDERVKPQGINVNDYVDPVSVATKADQPIGRFPNCDLTETKCKDLQGNGSMDSDECPAVSKADQYDETLKTFRDNVEASDTWNHKELINLEIVPHDHPQGRKVMEALKLFKEEYDKLLHEHESEPRVGKNTKGPHFVAAERVREKGMNFCPDKPFGHIPGIEIGDEFSFRAELATVGLNRQFTPGIDYVTVNGTQYATSVVDSGRYENKAKEHDILIYSGQGGNPNISVNCASDQKLERGNLALFNSMKKEFPVRVIHKRKGPMESNMLGVNDKRNYVYVYDGLYKVNNYWIERNTQNCKLVYKFELQRLPGQPRIRVITDDCEPLPRWRRNCGTDVKARKQVKDICVLDDVSQGEEKFKVRAMNGVDDDHPPPFTYTTNIVYPHLYWLREPVACDCVNGCSDSVQCPCVMKNGGEIPYTEKGLLMKARINGAVHECGPSCKCPPSCMNRVSQGGPRFQLEIFKTKSMGWGVRSRNYIMPGSFICEYIGELLSESEANQRIGKDEYLFDICHGKSQEDDFALDAAKYGNIGRFINHSCDPNVFSQKVLYDHDDKRVPHIMFFASKRIPPWQELMYDYNYAKVRVCDADGNIKRKACHCGSRKCTGRLY